MKNYVNYVALGLLTLGAGCSSDLPGQPVNEEPGDLTAGQRYIAVNILTTGGASTRDGEGTADKDYEDGQSVENSIKKVRFYFFDAAGNAAAVKADNTNYYDWSSPGTATTDPNDKPNVEKTLEAVIVISTKQEDQFPVKIAAVANPDQIASDKLTGNMSLSQLQAVEDNFVPQNLTMTDEGKFVMFSTAYATGINAAGNTPVYAVEITGDSYQTTEALAKSNPVIMFIERNVAKVRVKFKDGVLSDGRIALKETSETEGTAGADLKVNESQVYFKPEGWNVCADTKAGLLVKSIDNTWKTDHFTTTLAWNHSDNFRCYWAKNKSGYPSSSAITDQNWLPFSSTETGVQTLTSKTWAGTDFALNATAYVNENALDTWTVEQQKTKVAIAGKLVTVKDGTETELTLVKYLGQTYADDATTFTALKKAILDFMKLNGKMVYKQTVADGVTTRTSLTESDIKLVTAYTLDNTLATETKTGRYYVYAQLEATEGTYYATDANATEGEKTYTVTEVNNIFKNDLGKAQAFKSGMCYYYFPIQHLNQTGAGAGQYGVVRNHIYDCTVEGITGLGTPVYDPTETVYPEKRTDDDYYIAAQIKVHSWRVVPNTVTLKW